MVMVMDTFSQEFVCWFQRSTFEYKWSQDFTNIVFKITTSILQRKEKIFSGMFSTLPPPEKTGGVPGMERVAAFNQIVEERSFNKSDNVNIILERSFNKSNSSETIFQ